MKVLISLLSVLLSLNALASSPGSWYHDQLFAPRNLTAQGDVLCAWHVEYSASAEDEWLTLEPRINPLFPANYTADCPKGRTVSMKRVGDFWVRMADPETTYMLNKRKEYLHLLSDGNFVYINAYNQQFKNYRQ